MLELVVAVAIVTFRQSTATDWTLASGAGGEGLSRESDSHMLVVGSVGDFDRQAHESQRNTKVREAGGRCGMLGLWMPWVSRVVDPRFRLIEARRNGGHA